MSVCVDNRFLYVSTYLPLEASGGYVQHLTFALEAMSFALALTLDVNSLALKVVVLIPCLQIARTSNSQRSPVVRCIVTCDQ